MSSLDQSAPGLTSAAGSWLHIRRKTLLTFLHLFEVFTLVSDAAEGSESRKAFSLRAKNVLLEACRGFIVF